MKKSWYSIGCAFNLNEILYNFPYKKLSISCEDCQEINGNPHRNILVKLIFRECFKIIINDVIDNNITFHLPTGSRACNIHMKRVRGDEFKYLRQSGKWRDVDILESNFTGYELGFYMYGNRVSRIKNIYVNRSFRDKITSNTNKGMLYGDSNKDRKLSDYYEIMYSKFPKVPKLDINRILNFSFKSLYLHNSYGGDVIINDKDIWCYIGFLKKDSLKHFLYYIKKLTVKLRVLYKRKNIKWDGYYYFAINKSQYDSLFNNKLKKGRPKKKYTFKNICLYQILDECKINEYYKQYIFRIPYLSYINVKFLKQELTTGKAELIIERSPLKFKDILVYNNNYEFL